ncbi:7-cyano-7-deazaguanine synthase [Candidatus Pacearchaeota archaeon]|nr:7-cyano-7-deazaguanine synthase [Candidatus Pacearchaeota archaeon]
MKNAIILCSGGLDSVVTAYYVKNKAKYGKIYILFFNYGQRTLKQEKRASKLCAEKLNGKFIEIKLPELNKISTSLINSAKKANKVSRKQLKNTEKEHLNWYVPCRNIIFLTYALAIAESKLIKNKQKYDIFTGFKNEGKEAYPDATSEFVSIMNKLQATAVKKNIRIIAPLINKDKEDIIQLGKEFGVDFRNTYSCYVGVNSKNNKHCGTCLSCRLRQEGFYWAGLQDPTNYEIKMKDFPENQLKNRH